jgi:hypothetical protein
MQTTFNRPLNQAMQVKRSNTLPLLIVVLGVLLALGAAAYGFYESRRTERIVIAVNPLRYGQQITAADLATIEVAFHRPDQLAGMADPGAIIGKWASGDIRPNDLFQLSMVLDQRPDQPVYPSGEELGRNMVSLPFSVATLGPVDHADLVNIGYNDMSGDAGLCTTHGGQRGPVTTTPDGKSRPFACRLLTSVNVLHVDGGVAYLEVTPEQSHAVWALQAAGVQLWGERYGSTSDPLANLDRLDASQITPQALQIPGDVPDGTPGQDATHRSPDHAHDEALP